MKHTLQRLLPLLFFALLLLSCQDDANEHSHEHDDGFGITYKHFKEFKNLPGLIESTVPKNGRSRTAKGGGMYDFVIDSTSVMEANSDQGTFYTMAITRDSLRGDIFENLVIADKDTVKEAYIITYFPDKEYLDDLEYNEHAPYIGGIKLTVLDYEKMVQRGGSTVEQCKNITISFCNYSRTNDGSYHVAGPNCGSIFWTWTGRLCETIFVPDPEPDEQFNLKDPKVGGGGGGGAIPGPPKDKTDVITQPIPPGLKKDLHIQNCDELTKMSQDPKFAERITVLKNKAANQDFESAYVINNSAGNIIISEEMQGVPGSREVEIKRFLSMTQTPLNCIGVMHCHLDKRPTDTIARTFKVFTFSDFIGFGEITRVSTRPSREFAVYVTTSSGTLALKIKDKSVFLSNLKTMKEHGWVYEMGFEKHIKINANFDTQVLGLLNFMKEKSTVNENGSSQNMGLELYKQRDDGVWEKLELNSTGRSIIYKPC